MLPRYLGRGFGTMKSVAEAGGTCMLSQRATKQRGKHGPSSCGAYGCVTPDFLLHYGPLSQFVGDPSAVSYCHVPYMHVSLEYVHWLPLCIKANRQDRARLTRDKRGFRMALTSGCKIYSLSPRARTLGPSPVRSSAVARWQGLSRVKV